MPEFNSEVDLSIYEIIEKEKLDKCRERKRERDRINQAKYRANNLEKHKAYGRSWYHKNKEKLNEKRKLDNRLKACTAEGKAKNKEIYYKRRYDKYEHILLWAARRRAKDKGLEFNIEVSDIIIPDTCPVLGIPLIHNKEKLKDNSPSIDRKDNSKGYIKGNIKVISFRANTLKRNATAEELKLVIKYIESDI